jgi:hypothetical protein
VEYHKDTISLHDADISEFIEKLKTGNDLTFRLSRVDGSLVDDDGYYRSSSRLGQATTKLLYKTLLKA